MEVLQMNKNEYGLIIQYRITNEKTEHKPEPVVGKDFRWVDVKNEVAQEQFKLMGISDDTPLDEIMERLSRVSIPERTEAVKVALYIYLPPNGEDGDGGQRILEYKYSNFFVGDKHRVSPCCIHQVVPQSTDMIKSEFEKTVKEVRKLNKKAFRRHEDFRLSTHGLSECFRWMLKAELENNINHCYFSLDGYAFTLSKMQQLKDMGFKVEDVMDEKRSVLTGWNVSWNIA
jgi:hypothetical protein